MNFFGNFGRSGLWHMDQNEWFLNQNLPYKCSVFDSDPDGRNQNQQLLGEKKVWRSTCMNIDSTLRKFWINRIMTPGTKPPTFRLGTILQVQSFLWNFKWKNWSMCFFEKKEMQCKGNSVLIALFGIPSIWGSQNDMFQLKYFWNIFLTPEKLELR